MIIYESQNLLEHVSFHVMAFQHLLQFLWLDRVLLLVWRKGCCFSENINILLPGCDMPGPHFGNGPPIKVLV